jgi:hypothetical protein
MVAVEQVAKAEQEARKLLTELLTQAVEQVAITLAAKLAVLELLL